MVQVRSVEFEPARYSKKRYALWLALFSLTPAAFLLANAIWYPAAHRTLENLEVRVTARIVDVARRRRQVRDEEGSLKLRTFYDCEYQYVYRGKTYTGDFTSAYEKQRHDKLPVWILREAPSRSVLTPLEHIVDYRLLFYCGAIVFGVMGLMFASLYFWDRTDKDEDVESNRPSWMRLNNRGERLD